MNNTLLAPVISKEFQASLRFSNKYTRRNLEVRINWSVAAVPWSPLVRFFIFNVTVLRVLN